MNFLGDTHMFGRINVPVGSMSSIHQGQSKNNNSNEQAPSRQIEPDITDINRPIGSDQVNNFDPRNHQHQPEDDDDDLSITFLNNTTNFPGSLPSPGSISIITLLSESDQEKDINDLDDAIKYENNIENDQLNNIIISNNNGLSSSPSNNHT